MNRTHVLKIEKEFAEAVLSGDKNFEVRYNDRGYQKGDRVGFIAVNKGMEQFYNPLQDKEYRITYVLSGGGLKDGYVVFGIKEEGEQE